MRDTRGRFLCVVITSRLCYHNLEVINLPRNAREKSKSGIYHIMLRGINGQQIFEDDKDYEKLLQTIAQYKSKCEYDVSAYCLISNHIH